MMKERVAFRQRGLSRADRVSFLIVGIGIVVINVVLIALLFSPWS